MTTFTLPDNRVIGYSYSNPDKQPVVVLAGPLMASYRAWDLVAPVLKEAGYAVLRYDLPGHGASTTLPNPEDTTFESTAEGVHALLEHLEVPKVHAWVGVSMGAATGVVFASRFRGVVGKLVICDTVVCSPEAGGSPDLLAARVDAAREYGHTRKDLEETLVRWFDMGWQEGNPEEIQRMREVMEDTTVDGLAAGVASLRAKKFDLRELAPGLLDAVEDVLIVMGDLDTTLLDSMKELGKKISEDRKGKEVEVKLVKAAGHAVFVDGFEEFCEIVKGFL